MTGTPPVGTVANGDGLTGVVPFGQRMVIPNASRFGQAKDAAANVHVREGQDPVGHPQSRPTHATAAKPSRHPAYTSPEAIHPAPRIVLLLDYHQTSIPK